jgi:hypothetical protein
LQHEIGIGETGVFQPVLFVASLEVGEVCLSPLPAGQVGFRLCLFLGKCLPQAFYILVFNDLRYRIRALFFRNLPMT